MSSLLKFFIQLGKLKENKRKGWLLYRLKEPSTTADHVFRSAILGWALNKEKGLDEGKIIKSILIHHIPDIHIGEEIPYDAFLSKDLLQKKGEKGLAQILKKLPQVEAGVQKKRAIKREKIEQKTFNHLISRLPDELKKEIEGLWNELSKKRTKVAKFAWEAGKTETYLQAFEYWKKQGKLQHKLWLRWAKKNLKNPTLSKFRREIDKVFIGPRKKRSKSTISDIMGFLMEVGKLKTIKRTGWVMAQAKKPETVAQHTFQMTIMSWFLGTLKGLDTNRIVKIALAHDLCEVYAVGHSPYDPILISSKEEARKIVEKPARMPRAERLEWLLHKRAKEWKAIVKLTSNLPKVLQDEIIGLWIDCEEGLTKEGRFVSQVNKMANLFQAIEYWKKDKKFPIMPWWILIKERVDDPLLLKFAEELDKEFAIAKRGRKKS